MGKRIKIGESTTECMKLLISTARSAAWLWGWSLWSCYDSFQLSIIYKIDVIKQYIYFRNYLFILEMEKHQISIQFSIFSSRPIKTD